MIRPRIVLPSLPAPSVSPLTPPAPTPLSSICRTALLPIASVLTDEPISVYASIVTAPVIVGKAEVRLIVFTPAPPMLNTIVSVPAAALALSDRRHAAEPAARQSFAVVTVKVASAWSQPACVLSLITTEVSIDPVVASSCQSAYSATWPVRSVLAATSAPVNVASVWMASLPGFAKTKVTAVDQEVGVRRQAPTDLLKLFGVASC